jgi:hypothetical protein
LQRSSLRFQCGFRRFFLGCFQQRSRVIVRSAFVEHGIFQSTSIVIRTTIFFGVLFERKRL